MSGSGRRRGVSGRRRRFGCGNASVATCLTRHVNPHQLDIVLPDDFALPPGGLNIRWPDQGFGQRMALALQVLMKARGTVATTGMCASG